MELISLNRREIIAIFCGKCWLLHLWPENLENDEVMESMFHQSLAVLGVQ